MGTHRMSHPRQPGLVHALIVATSMVQVAVLPLLARYSHHYRLSTAAVGLLVALPSLGMLITSLPAGVLADRYGVRSVTVSASALLALACLLSAAGPLSLLFAGRVLFGVAYGTVWSTCPAWLAELSRLDAGRGSRVGSVVTSSAVGSTLGPLLAGLLADRYGVGSPFLLMGSVALLLTIKLAALPSSRPRTAPRPAAPAWRALPAVVREQPAFSAALVAMVVCGGVAGVTQLLIPLQLHRAGSSATSIGVVLSVAGLIYIAASAATARVGARMISAPIVGWGCVLITVSLLPAALGRSTPLLVTTVLVFTLARAGVNTISYPLAVGDGESGQLGNGALLGLLNLGWSVSMAAAPLVAGWLAQQAGLGLAYLVTAVVAGMLSFLPHSRRLWARACPAAALAMAGNPK